MKKQSEVREDNQRSYFRSMKSFGKIVKEEDLSDDDSEYDIDETVTHHFYRDLLYTELPRDDQNFMELWNGFIVRYNNETNVKKSTTLDKLSYQNMNGEFLKPSKFIFILEKFLAENKETLLKSLRNQFLNHLFTLMHYMVITPNQLLSIITKLKG